MEERATCPHSNALSGTSGSGIVAGQKKAADLTGLPVPIISKLVDGLMHVARTNIDKRSRLLSAAVELTYQNGFEATSLADIAREAKVPLGNVYYYFKTKDEIGEAIVELRLAQLSAQRQRWNEAGSPKGSALRLRPRRLREQGLLGAARLRGRDVLLRAPQGGRLGRHQSDRDLRSTPGLDRGPVSGTREGKRLQRSCRAPAFRDARRFDPGSCLSRSRSCGEGDQAPEELDSKLVRGQAG